MKNQAYCVFACLAFGGCLDAKNLDDDLGTKTVEQGLTQTIVDQHSFGGNINPETFVYTTPQTCHPGFVRQSVSTQWQSPLGGNCSFLSWFAPSNPADCRANILAHTAGGFSGGTCTTFTTEMTQPNANLFAVVGMTGTVITGNHVQSVTHYGPGRYEVTFDRDVNQCAYVATTANTFSQALTAYTAGGHLGPQGVYLETRTQGFGLTDSPFHLFVACDAPGIRRAVVGYQANLARASAGTNLRFLGSGRYAITFDAPLSSCAYLATVGDPASALVSNPSGAYTGSYTDPQTVYIETKNPGGGLQNGVPFHLAVICPQASGARFAVVRSDGVAIRSSASTTASHVNTGRDAVATGQPISDCATIATRGSVDTSVPFTPTTAEVIPGASSTATGIELRDLLFFGGNLRDEAFHAATICSTP